MPRKLVTAATMAGLLVIVCVMAVVGFKSVFKPLPGTGDKTDPSSTCSKAETSVKTSVARKDVKVSVFNAGGRKGEAGDTLARLEAIGFVAGEVANAPVGTTVPRAVVWTTEKDDTSAKLVAANLGPNTQVIVTTKDLGPGIDVLVGKRFHGLNPKAPRAMPLPAPEKTCVKVS